VGDHARPAFPDLTHALVFLLALTSVAQHHIFKRPPWKLRGPGHGPWQGPWVGRLDFSSVIFWGIISDFSADLLQELKSISIIHLCTIIILFMNNYLDDFMTFFLGLPLLDQLGLSPIKWAFVDIIWCGVLWHCQHLSGFPGWQQRRKTNYNRSEYKKDINNGEPNENKRGS